MLTRYLPEAEQRSLIAAAAMTHDPYAQRDAAAFRALLHSGCRITEFSLIDIHAAQFAIAHRRLVIPREHRKGHSKGRVRDHVILATDALTQDLKDLLRLRETITGIGAAQLAPTDALIVNRYGARLSVRSYQLRIKHWAAAAGIKASVTPHFLRHSRAHNIMRKSGAADPRGIVQQQLGHASIASTGIYTQPAEHEVMAALTACDARPAARKRDAIKAFREGRAA